MIILGIETSCDDTGIAIVEVSPTRKAVGARFNILSNVVSSQIKTHAPFGGVVPNLAAREHLKNIEPCLRQAFQKTNLKPSNIDLIAVTIGPGLIPCLLIGVNFAKTLAYVWKKPIVAVNHLEGHIIASMINGNPKSEIPARHRYAQALADGRNPKPRRRTFGSLRGRQIQNSNFQNSKQLFPAIALVVSGGHTQLVLVKKLGDYKIIGETRDDAAGECFDKVAKLLGLSYPGGPKIAAEAAKYEIRDTKYEIQLPRPMIKQKNFDFSFSGLKTAVLYLLKDIEQKYHIFYDRRKSGIDIIPELCHETQQAIIDVLIEKTLRAAKEYKAKTIILSGGVAANEELRNQLNVKCELLNVNFLVPPKNLCTDNGAMVAVAGYFRYKLGIKTDWRKIKADANLRIGQKM